MFVCSKTLVLVDHNVKHNSTIHDTWHLCDRNRTPRCKAVIKACIINVLNVIWYRRNQAIFQDNLLHWKSVVNLIISNVSLSSNNTKKTSAISMYLQS